MKRKVAPKKSAPAFWLVWRDGHNSSPHYRHATLKAAREEAERLARQNPANRFYVLPARDYVEAFVSAPEWKNDAPALVPSYAGDEPPF